MKIINLKSTNPYLNLATEFYLLKHIKEECFILWQNDKSIIIGRNQNTIDEINQIYVDDKKINVVRRISGGGAVFHDLGNLNYSIILNNVKDLKKEIKRQLNIIISFLKELGIDAIFSGRNDILVNEKKVSGVAYYKFNNKILIHGTLLFDVNLDTLESCLNVNKMKIISKGIKSIKSRVSNLIEYLPETNIKTFKKQLVLFLENKFRIKSESIDQNKKIILNLVKKQFKNNEWIWGKNFESNFSNSVKNDNALFTCNLLIEKNKIKKIKIFSDILEDINFNFLEKKLINKSYNIEEINKIIKENKIKFKSISNKELLYLIFKND